MTHVLGGELAAFGVGEISTIGESESVVGSCNVHVGTVEGDVQFLVDGVDCEAVVGEEEGRGVRSGGEGGDAGVDVEELAGCAVVDGRVLDGG